MTAKATAIAITFECNDPYEVALLCSLYRLLRGEENEGREAAKERLCDDCFARLRAEVQDAFPDFAHKFLGGGDDG